MNILLKLLKYIFPKWMVDDIYNYFTHPYWRKKKIDIHENNRIISMGITGKKEKLSSREPFKRVNKKKILTYFQKENVRKILDVGCGVGNLVNELTKEGYEAYGISINTEEIKIENNPNIIIYDIQSDLKNSPFKEGQFDAILSFDCLEHLESPLIALKNINRVLKDNGVFISCIPPVRWTECDYHIIVYTPRQFRWLLNLAGFDLIEKEGRFRMSKKGATYYARKIKSNGLVYPGILE